jgi:hypothetical protein
MENYSFEGSVLALSCIFTVPAFAQVYAHHDVPKPAPLVFWSCYYRTLDLARG